MNEPDRRDEAGFTLIELLVVILIVAILAAIAIPVYINQRQKGQIAAAQSALKNGALAIESYIAAGGSVDDLDGADSAADNAEYQLLVDDGYRKSVDVDITVEADPDGDYCLISDHQSLTASHDWRVASYSSEAGEPTDADTCP